MAKAAARGRPDRDGLSDHRSPIALRIGLQITPWSAHPSTTGLQRPVPVALDWQTRLSSRSPFATTSRNWGMHRIKLRIPRRRAADRTAPSLSSSLCRSAVSIACVDVRERNPRGKHLAPIAAPKSHPCSCCRERFLRTAADHQGKLSHRGTPTTRFSTDRMTTVG